MCDFSAVFGVKLTFLTVCITFHCVCVHTCIFPEDKLEQQHALFTQYKDPCRLGPGEDKPWALGNNTQPNTCPRTSSFRVAPYAL